MSTIGFIGAGNMAQAIIKGIINAGLYSSQNIIISDITPGQLELCTRQFGVTTTTCNTELVTRSDVIVLSIKPQVMGSILDEIKESVTPDKTIISIAAGITTSKIAAAVGSVPIIRVMPNTPALVGCGMAGLFSANADQNTMKTATDIFSAIGQAVVVDSEDLIDAVTAVSGSGPAYFFLMMEQMIHAGTKLGLDKDTATQLVLQTAKGAALLAEQSDDTPDVLRQKVTSPGGTTQAALEVFQSHNFDQTVEAALAAADKRAKELSK